MTARRKKQLPTTEAWGWFFARSSASSCGFWGWAAMRIEIETAEGIVLLLYNTTSPSEKVVSFFV
jgi:hypothetical protein